MLQLPLVGSDLFLKSTKFQPERLIGKRGVWGFLKKFLLVVLRSFTSESLGA